MAVHGLGCLGRNNTFMGHSSQSRLIGMSSCGSLVSEGPISLDMTIPCQTGDGGDVESAIDGHKVIPDSVQHRHLLVFSMFLQEIPSLLQTVM